MEATLSICLRTSNASFEEKLNVDDDYVSLCNKILFQGIKSLGDCKRFYAKDPQWHYVVDRIYLNAFGNVGGFLNDA